MTDRTPASRVRFARNAVQLALALYLLLSGVQFYLFVEHFLTQGATPFVPRPAVVEAFLPLSALIALRGWLGTGVADTIHPAGMVILATTLATSLCFGKAFCAWLCPIGALSEGLWRLGRRVTGRTIRLPRTADWILQSIKYLLLLFFLKSILFDFTPAMAHYFARTSYNQIADVKMLFFFLRLSLEVGIALALFGALSLFIPNFWCRYLCPYGAALGILSVFAPLKVQRNPSACSGCGACDRACPEALPVAQSDRVESPVCSRCLDCVAACPRRGALGVAITNRLPGISPLLFALAFLVAYFGLLVAAQVAGHWETSITYETYARLIPRFDAFNHAW